MSRVLVVDDDNDILQFCENVLLHAGHEPLLETTGIRALDLLKKHRIDLVLLDIAMPQMTGVQFLKELQNVETNKPAVVMLTRKKTKNDVQSCIQAGAADYLVKPIEAPDVFLKRINKALKKVEHAPKAKRQEAVDIEASSGDGMDLRDPIQTTGLSESISETEMVFYVEKKIERNFRVKIKSDLFAEMGITPPTLFLKTVRCEPFQKQPKGLDAKWKFELFASTIAVASEPTLFKIRAWTLANGV